MSIICHLDFLWKIGAVSKSNLRANNFEPIRASLQLFYKWSIFSQELIEESNKSSNSIIFTEIEYVNVKNNPDDISCRIIDFMGLTCFGGVTISCAPVPADVPLGGLRYCFPPPFRPYVNLKDQSIDNAVDIDNNDLLYYYLFYYYWSCKDLLRSCVCWSLN